MKSTSISLFVSIVTFLLLAGYFWFVCDDAFISFRYSDNLANGYGLVYNYHEAPPIEGYSNFLWVLLGALYTWLGLDITTLLPVTSILSGIFGLVILAKALEHFQVSNKLQCLTLLSTSIFPPYFIYGTSGLETLPAAVSLFATFFYLLIKLDLVKASAFALILALLRPEGILWVVVISILSLFNNNYKITFKFLGIVLSCFTIYFCWRWNYFEELLPVTVTNKVGLTSFTLLRGLNYSIIYFLTYLLPILLFSLLIISIKNIINNKLLATIVVLFLGLLIYPITTGGDFMTSGRFFVNTALFQALLFGILLSKFKSLPVRSIYSSAVGVVSVMSLLAAFNLMLIPKSILSNFHFRLNSPDYRTEAEQYSYMKYNSERWSVLGKALNKLTESGDSIVAGAIGNLGFYSKRHIFDRFGLVEKRIANLPNIERKAKSPGHDKSVNPEFFLDNNPTIIKAYIMPSANQERLDNQLKAWQNTYQGKYQGEHHPLSYVDSKGRKLSVLILRRINSI